MSRNVVIGLHWVYRLRYEVWVWVWNEGVNEISRIQNSCPPNCIPTSTACHSFCEIQATLTYIVKMWTYREILLTPFSICMKPIHHATRIFQERGAATRDLDWSQIGQYCRHCSHVIRYHRRYLAWTIATSNSGNSIKYVVWRIYASTHSEHLEMSSLLRSWSKMA